MRRCSTRSGKTWFRKTRWEGDGSHSRRKWLRVFNYKRLSDLQEAMVAVMHKPPRDFGAQIIKAEARRALRRGGAAV